MSIETLFIWLIVLIVLVFVIGEVAHILMQRRTHQTIETLINAYLQTGAAERAEILRTVQTLVGIQQIQDTAVLMSEVKRTQQQQVK